MMLLGKVQGKEAMRVEGYTWKLLSWAIHEGKKAQRERDRREACCGRSNKVPPAKKQASLTHTDAALETERARRGCPSGMRCGSPLYSILLTATWATLLKEQVVQSVHQVGMMIHG